MSSLRSSTRPGISPGTVHLTQQGSVALNPTLPHQTRTAVRVHSDRSGELAERVRNNAPMGARINSVLSRHPHRDHAPMQQCPEQKIAFTPVDK